MHNSNVFKGSFIIGVVLIAALFAYAGMARAAGPTCSVPGDYATIQAAVNDVGCTTINVAAGTYAEHVSVNRSVILNGANTGIAGNGVRGAESIVNGTDTDAPFAITANNVTINGFTVENGSNGGLFSGIWSQTGTQNSSILNNIITQNGFGVWAQCGGNCLIQANLFDGNNKSNSPGSGGISADSTTGLTINNNEFKNHTAGNPILLQAVAPGAHTNIIVSNNNFHGNTNSNVYVLGVNGGAFSGNTITPASDATGISFSGADANITVTNNIITGGARGVRIEDAGYYSESGGNSNITVNKNSLASDSEYGAGNLSGYTGNVDATCNWWGAANGPGTVGPGSGSPVTTNVNFATWLTSSNLAGTCNGPLSQVTVTIDKFIDGVHATAANAGSSSFPMLETWVATNFSGTDVSYTLSPIGLNTASPYEAVTAPAFDSGASYTTHEVTGGAAVGANCSDGKPYALVGYSSGDTFALAVAAATSTTAPNFADLLGNKVVIVWNKNCTPPPPPPPPANACATPGTAPAGFTLRNGTTGNDLVTLAPQTMFVGRGGNDIVRAGNGNYIVCTGSGNDLITLGNGSNIIDAGGGNNIIRTGDGNQNVTTGAGNDLVTTGSGNDTIHAGAGNNIIQSGAGNDSITTLGGNDIINGGAGTDTCSAGGGVNLKQSCELP